MYVTYDLEQKTRSDGSAIYPKVKRVYIAGQVLDWKVGVVKKKSGREVYGVQINYEQSRKSYYRKGYTAQRGKTTYETSPASVGAASQTFAQVIEVPKGAGNVRSIRTLVSCQRCTAMPCSASVKSAKSVGPPADATRTLLS